MSRSSEMSGADGRASAGPSLIRFALRPAPHRFGTVGFAIRTCQHLLVYSAILAIAVYVCALLFAPVETSVISIVCIVATSLVVALLSSPPRKLFRLLEGGLAASYVAGAAALLKAFEAFFHRM